MSESEELQAAQRDLREAMAAQAAATGAGGQAPPAVGRREVYVPKVRVRVKLDEVSLRLTFGDKHLDRKLVDACLVPFLKAYNNKVETHKQVELEELISVKINGELIGTEDIQAQARYILGRAWARACDVAQSKGNTADEADVEILMELGTRETHEREWYESGRKGPWPGPEMR